MAGNELPKREANYSPLTPITFLERAAQVFPDTPALVYGRRRFNWAQTLERCRRIASSLRSHSISPGDTVAVVAPNVPAIYELHFAVPMAGAVLNAINMRLDAKTMAVILSHSGAKVVFADTAYVSTVQEALTIMSADGLNTSAAETHLVHVWDEKCGGSEFLAGKFHNLPEYEMLVARGDPNFPICWPKDEWDAIVINYTSGTTSMPKGVVCNHRSVYLQALVSALEFGVQRGSVFLWILPMFHANGWCFPWIMAAQAGTNICSRTVTAEGIFDALCEHGVTHMNGAPVVLNMIANAPEHKKRALPRRVHVLTAGAPPPAALLEKCEALGFWVTHGYGLTETLGVTVSCVWKDRWNALPSEERALLKARQGVPNLGISATDVLDPETMKPVPRDGKTMGEVMIKGHIMMKGYLKDQQATENAFSGGWFHTGDIGVMDPDGYLRIKDRSKDIIITGGENVSSIEVESVLFRHPHVLEAAVVARPDEHWGETPCAFVTLKECAPQGSQPDAVSEKTLILYCRTQLPGFKIPRTIVFDKLPKTVTGKVQKNVLRERARRLGPNSSAVTSKL